METDLPKVRMKLVGVDGNAFYLLGLFRSLARRQGWPESAIDEVLIEAKAGDYSHLLSTLMDHIQDPFGQSASS